MISAILTLTGLAFGIGVLLTIAANKLGTSNSSSVVERINDLLPQTQCGQCKYPGCRPYAEAIAQDTAPINQCPPGGSALIEKLAHLLGKETVPLNAEHGMEKPAEVAFIHEDLCIGCKKCILACPVDAILGTSKKMHTVINSECTGCELCIEPCPVDCIDMISLPVAISTWRTAKPESPAYEQ